MTEVGLGVAVFTMIISTLVLMIVAAGALLTPKGDVEVRLNDGRLFKARAGRKLLEALAEEGIHLPSACGGRGTCGQCVVTVQDGAEPPLAVETSLLRRDDLLDGTRLACQLTLRDDLAVSIPSEILGVRKFACTVRSNRSVATLMTELVLELPAGEEIDFAAGGFIQVTSPPHQTAFTSFDVGAEYRGDWDRLDLWRHAVTSTTPTTRAYSIASPPSENRVLRLIVRIAIPPPGAPDTVPPGVVSSYLFGLKRGDAIEIAGPYGNFAVADSDHELVFLGGGAGMAPLRSMIFDQLERVRTTRTMTFWYGARNLTELFYREDFEELQTTHENFRWTVALSEPGEHDEWRGEIGFIHDVLYERHLADHPAPEKCDYYLCGPPMMIQAAVRMLTRLGVDRESIRFDDFGT